VTDVYRPSHVSRESARTGPAAYCLRPPVVRPRLAVRLSLAALAMLLLLSPVASRQLTVIRVPDRGDLQAALNAAKPGDLILLAPGGRYIGTFVLPALPESTQAFITVRTDSDSLPTANSRITPDASGTLALIQSTTSDPALRTASRAHHWRIENVEFGPTRTGTTAIIELGDAHQSRDEVPHDLVLDRVYVHGDAEKGQRRGIALNSASTEVRNSYIAEIKGIGVDTQALGGWNGPGPFVIENNYLEAAGEVIMFGGGDPSIDGLVPRHIIIRGNHVTRPVAWRDAKWTVKNLFELKNAADVIVDGNLFETHWGGGQPGYAIVLTPRNQDGGAPWSTVTGLRFTNNIVRHVAAGVNISGSDDRHPSGPARDITIENNLFVDVDGKAWGGPGDFLQIGRGASDVRVEHNTVQHTGRMVWVYGKEPITGFVFRGNVIQHNAYGVMGDNASPGRVTFERFLPGAVFEQNVIAGGERSKYPGDNQFIGGSAFADLFDNMTDGAFHLRMPGAGADSDGIERAARAR
jgi:hypothetical protein